jgi:hypothetical protein
MHLRAKCRRASFGGLLRVRFNSVSFGLAHAWAELSRSTAPPFGRAILLTRRSAVDCLPPPRSRLVPVLPDCLESACRFNRCGSPGL